MDESIGMEGIFGGSDRTESEHVVPIIGLKN